MQGSDLIVHHCGFNGILRELPSGSFCVVCPVCPNPFSPWRRVFETKEEAINEWNRGLNP